MRKTTLIVMAILTNAVTAIAGGLLTNTNQTVHFLRNPARGASLEIDGVYTNPAGLIFLNEGFHFTLNNQSAIQTRTITSTYAPFAGFGGSATKEYAGEAKAPFIPSLMAAYRMGNWAFSGSFSIVGGGGTAVFENGLPSFESQIAAPIAALSAASRIPTNYSLKSRMEGSSIIYGFQLGATYKINDNFSAYLGGRISMVNNGYVGYLNNVNISESEKMITFFTTAAMTARGTASSLQQLAGFFGNDATIGAVGNAGQLTAEQIAQMAAGLGLTPEQFSAYTLLQAQGAFNGAATQADGAVEGINQLQATNLELDTKQSGYGFTPVLGLNFNYENFNLGVKYEFISKFEVENKTKVDGTGMFPDKAKTPHDLAALLTIGASYKIIPSLTISGGYHHFFDSDAKMAKIEDPKTGVLTGKQNYINGGINEYLFGAEWRINDRFLVSAGTQITRSSATDAYQTDLSHFLNSVSVGFGGAVDVTENVRINAGYFFTMFEDWTQELIFPDIPPSITNVFGRTSRVFGIGVDFRF